MLAQRDRRIDITAGYDDAGVSCEVAHGGGIYIDMDAFQVKLQMLRAGNHAVHLAADITTLVYINST